jgi:hypothetical protein
VHRDDPLPFDPDAVPFHFAPYPALSTIGHTDDGDVWLLDLERVAALTLTGAVDRCLDLIRALAAELAHNVWSEQLQVTLVGFGRQMAELNPARLSYRDDLSTLLRHCQPPDATMPAPPRRTRTWTPWTADCAPPPERCGPRTWSSSPPTAPTTPN